MGRKFTQDINMKVNLIQYEGDLRQALLSMGYTERALDLFYFDAHPLITTMPALRAVTNAAIFLKESKRSYHIDHYNPKLFLALAAMSEGEEFWPGEWVTEKEKGFFERIHSEHYSYPSKWHNEFMEIYEIENEEDGERLILTLEDFCGKNGYKSSIMRKATAEEIIQHFTKKEEVVKQYIEWSQIPRIMSEGVPTIKTNPETEKLWKAFFEIANSTINSISTNATFTPTPNQLIEVCQKDDFLKTIKGEFIGMWENKYVIRTPTSVPGVNQGFQAFKFARKTSKVIVTKEMALQCVADKMGFKVDQIEIKG